MTAKYISNISPIAESDLTKYYNEIGATNWIWPRQDYNYNTWGVEYVYKLSKNYTIHIGSNINSIIELMPFSNCVNAKIIIRAWDYKNSNSTSCVPLDWIDIDQNTSTAIIQLSRITSVGTVEVGFQSQSFTFSSIINIHTYSDLYSSTFTFDNNNAKLVSSNIENYIVINEIKNMTITFVDDEEDHIFLNVSSTPEINVLVSSTQQNAVYKLIWHSANEKASVENINITYYDSYHKDSIYWKTLTVQINVFLSEPPRFSANLDNITVNMCSNNNFKLPSVIDPENLTFTISLIDENLKWIKILDLNGTSFLSIDTTFIGILSTDTQYSVGIKLVNLLGSFSIYYINITAHAQDTPYFETISNQSISSSKRYELNTKIISNFNILNLELNVEAIYWNSVNNVWWINQSSNSTSVIVNPNSSIEGNFWVKLVAQFNWKTSVM